MAMDGHQWNVFVLFIPEHEWDNELRAAPGRAVSGMVSLLDLLPGGGVDRKITKATSRGKGRKKVREGM
jgi:hypothetical protein